MGSDPIYVPISKASKILDCEESKVHELCDQGLVRRKLEGDVASVRREDIEEVYRLQLVGELRPGELIRRLLFAERKIAKLEGAVNMLYEINGLAGSRFSPMDDPEIHNLYGVVVDALGEDYWTVDQLVVFGEYFLRITEVEVERLNDLLQLDSSWMPFYRLCLKLTKFVGLSEDLDTNLEMQRVRDLLYQGRKNLQTIGVLFIEHKAQLGPSRELLAKMASADIDDFDTLAKQLITTTLPRATVKLL